MIFDVHSHIFDKSTWELYQKKLGTRDTEVISIPWCNKNITGFPDVIQLLKFTDTEKRIHAAGSIDMEQKIGPQLAIYEKLFKAKRVVAIKLNPGYQHFYPFDPRVITIAKLCAKYNKPLIFHSGCLDEDMLNALMKYAHPAHIDELANQCPNTKILISHAGFPYFMDMAMIVSKYKNVYTDISGTIDKDSPQAVKDLTSQYIKDLRMTLAYFPTVKPKILFGTDYCGENTTLNQIHPYVKVIKNILRPTEQKNAFSELAKKLFLEK